MLKLKTNSLLLLILGLTRLLAGENASFSGSEWLPRDLIIKSDLIVICTVTDPDYKPSQRNVIVSVDEALLGKAKEKSITLVVKPLADERSPAPVFYASQKYLVFLREQKDNPGQFTLTLDWHSAIALEGVRDDRANEHLKRAGIDVKKYPKDFVNAIRIAISALDRNTSEEKQKDAADHINNSVELFKLLQTQISMKIK